jgi:hypothetical protein
MVTSQTSGFSQQGKVTHEMRDEGFSIAHSSLPLNSKAKIANASTGKEVEVTITRLIPASQNRIADVSSSVWQELGLTSDTDARIYTSVSAKPQPIASQTTAPQTAVSSAAKPKDSAAEVPASLLGNMPSSVKFENNFIVNGNPVAPSAVAYETRTQAGGGVTTVPSTTDPASVAYYETQPAQPAVTTYETHPAQPSVTYYETQPAQPAMTSDMWVQITKPAVETQTQTTQPVVRIENQPQTYQPLAPYDTRTQSVQPAVTYETRPQQTQPVVRIINWPEYQQSYETQTQQTRQVITNETRTQQSPVVPAEKKLPEIQPNRVNEIWAPESRTFVYFDAPIQAPMPSVTIDNGSRSYSSVRQEEQGRDRK